MQYRHLQCFNRLESDADVLRDSFLFKHFSDETKSLIRVKKVLFKLEYTFVNQVDIEQILCESLHELQLADYNLDVLDH